MKEEIHHSFKELYDAKMPSNLPYNHTPEKCSGAGESTTFISVPTKRNAQAPPKVNSKSFNTFVKDFIASNRNEEVKSGAKYLYLDFEKALLPYPIKIVISQLVGFSSSNSNSRLELENSAHPCIIAIDKVLPRQRLSNESEWYCMNQLRIHAGCPDRSEDGINQLLKYYAQLQYLESKLPFDTGDVEIAFDCKCIQFEKASVLFNVASIYSQLGAQERLWSPEGKKRACGNFQKAAGIFLYIRDNLTRKIKFIIEAQSDLHEDNLSIMSTLMLAQAAECFYDKASDVLSTSQATAVIAIYVSDLYGNITKSYESRNYPLRQKLPKNILLQIKAKHYLFAAIAQFHTKSGTSVDRSIAERLARLECSKNLITLSMGFSQNAGQPIHDIIIEYAKTFTAAYLCVEGSNQDIHHETPFDERLLAPLRRPLEALVNPSSMTSIIKIIESNPHILIDCFSRSSSGPSSLNSTYLLKLNFLLETYEFEVPSSRAFCHNDMNDVKFEKMRNNALWLVKKIEEYNADEELISTPDLLICLRNLNFYISENIDQVCKV